MFNLVWFFSAFKCIVHMRPSSLKASFMSRTRTLKRGTRSASQRGTDASLLSHTYLSLALFACRRSFSFSCFTSGGSSSFPEELREFRSSSSSSARTLERRQASARAPRPSPGTHLPRFLAGALPAGAFSPFFPFFPDSFGNK